jgi:hypothetical protein
MASYFARGATTDEKKIEKPNTLPTLPRQHLMVKGRNGRPRGPARSGKRKPRSKGPSRRKGWSMGDLTLRDAADVTGAIIRGGARIATTIFNVEEKVFDFSQSATGATIQCICQIPQGTDYNNREGLSIKARNLLLNIYSRANLTAGTNFLRIIIFQDLENRGVAPTVADVFESTTTALNSVSPYNHILAERFRIMLDEHVTLIFGQQAYFARFVMPIDNHILFQTAAGSVPAQYEGSLYIFLIDSEAVNQSSTTYYTRLTFVDN